MVAPLSEEERRKLFDLPVPAASASTPPPLPTAAAEGASFLELDYERAHTTASNRAGGKVVQTIRIRGISAVVRIAVFTTAVTTLVLIALRFAYRF